MYEELVKELRSKAEFLNVSGARENSHGPNLKNSFAETMLQAADAIEKLSKVDTKANSIIDGLQNLLASVKERPRWIPVTERLPEEFQPVWVACKMEGRENWVFDTVYDPYLKCPWGPYYYLEKGEAVAYAWMDKSIPEPPKED